MGTHASRLSVDGDEVPPYVPRDIDDELDRRLREAALDPNGGMVLATGASTAGKTRAMLAALARTLPNRRIVHPPENTNLKLLPNWLKEKSENASDGWVVWMDDLERYLGPSGMDPSWISELGSARAIVAATIRTKNLEALRPARTDGPQTNAIGFQILKTTTPITIPDKWSPEERERAFASGDERLIEASTQNTFGISVYLAAGPQLQTDWEAGPNLGHPRGYALVSAAVNLASTGLSSAVTRQQLEDAHVEYLPKPPPLPEDSEDAWAWATSERCGVAGLLVPADAQGNQWRAFDYLTAANPPSEHAWLTSLNYANRQDRFTIAATAFSRGNFSYAEMALRPLAESGDPDAMFNLGGLAREVGRRKEAEQWLRKSSEAGHTIAMINLGHMLEQAGHIAEAESWYRPPAEIGITMAMSNLGNLLRMNNRTDEGESWLRPAAEAGDAIAMYNLGVLLESKGQPEETEYWYRKSAEAGDTDAMYNLGVILETNGHIEEAIKWYQKPAEAGNSNAMNNLGANLLNTGQSDKAEHWLRKGVEAGHTMAMNNLGKLMNLKGKAAEAEQLWRESINSGDNTMENSLGILLAKSGRLKEAEEYWTRAAKSGRTDAMNNLGSLYSHAGDINRAERWFRKSAEAGSAPAMRNLAKLLRKTGRKEEAASWIVKHRQH
ncbi:tetratricopeptide repeat protein [Nocardiopsis sp. NPDC049922]|uniref:tetratricopeptide repeat protein n=1 Tax=Nocardiopsis sp. NPDC049922 TaxID=3155157 RepID=UPI003411E70C